MIPSPVLLYHLLCYMALIAAATSFRTLRIPADCPTITLCPLPIAFTQLTNHPYRSAADRRVVVDAVDTLPHAHRPPSPFPPRPEDFPLSATLVHPLSVAPARFPAPLLLLQSMPPAVVVDAATVSPTATFAPTQPLAHLPRHCRLQPRSNELCSPAIFLPIAAPPLQPYWF
eukprot:scaffold5987_cov203-Amphora_coffeaeformis.AAC.2